MGAKIILEQVALIVLIFRGTDENRTDVPLTRTAHPNGKELNLNSKQLEDNTLCFQELITRVFVLHTSVLDRFEIDLSKAI